MKRRIAAILLAASMLTAMTPATVALGEEDMELFFSENELVQDKSEGEGDSVLDSLKDQNASIMEALGKKDWDAQAEAVKLTGDWRDDLVAVAQSQVGYQEEKDGMTIYARWAGKDAAVDWSALFVSWVADRTGLSSSEFPQGETYDALLSGMNSMKAVKKVSRSNYPTAGDLALIEVNGQKLAGIVTYVANGYASVIAGDDNGRVTKESYYVEGKEFKNYVDLNVLMERAGIEVGKGGEVPYIPDEGVAAWTNTNAVYMRSEPTRASKSLTTIKKARTALLVTSAAMQDDGYIWYGVQYQKYTGYIRGDLLELDRAALPTATPAPTRTPEPTAVPGCALCTNAALGLALPEECCYEHLASMSIDEAASFMTDLLKDDPTTFVLYASCVAAHVNAGDADLLCLGMECGMSAWSRPSAAHDPACPWHKDGLFAQERVVNIEVRETTAGQQTMIYFDIYSANTYQWHEVKSVVNADGTVTETDTVMAGENAASVVVTAKNEEDTTYSYYCVATIRFNGQSIELASKTTTLNVGKAPIVAEAIVGEEVNFTYSADGAASYQWYGPVLQADGAYAMGAIPGATSATYSTAADIAIYKSGLSYYCEALAANGAVLSTSGSYAYTLLAGSEHVHLYIKELLNMSRLERYEALNNTWYVSVDEIPGAASDIDKIAEDVMLTWYGVTDVNGTVQLPGMRAQYPDLLCTCIGSDTVEVPNGLLLHPHAEHDKDCPWYVPPVTFTSAGPSSGETDADLSIFKDCAAFPTECALVSSWVSSNASPMAIYNDLLALQSQPGYTADGDEYDMYFAALMHTAVHEGSDALLCSCVDDMYSTLIAPGAGHDATCVWHMAGVDAEELTARMESEPEFSAWAETATDEMIARALKAKTLDHLVVDDNKLYVAREENPRATVDDKGFIVDNKTGLVIAWIDYNADPAWVYPIANLPSHAPSLDENAVEQ